MDHNYQIISSVELWRSTVKTMYIYRCAVSNGVRQGGVLLLEMFATNITDYSALIPHHIGNHIDSNCMYHVLYSRGYIYILVICVVM